MFLLTKRSGNKKTGPIAVTTSGTHTCPTVCPFRGSGCYAEYGPLALAWRRVDRGAGNAGSWDQMCEGIRKLGGGLLRLNQAGDLPHFNGQIDLGACLELAAACRAANVKAFTYTHHDMTDPHNIEAVIQLREAGIAINLSANSLDHADQLADLDVAPVVVVLPHNTIRSTWTPQGHKVAICPAVIGDITCARCKLCAKQHRAIIGFPAHGTGKHKIHQSN